MVAMRRAILLFALLETVVTGCTARQSPVLATPLVPANTIAAIPPASGWHAVVMPADQQALDVLPAQFRQAWHDVSSQYKTRLVAEGPVVEPDAAQPVPALPPGPYHCRLMRFGGSVGFKAYDPDICYVQPGADALSFTKETGVTLLNGWVYSDTDARLVFLGTVRTDPTTKAQGYGDANADHLAGYVERVSPFRWRLVLTRAGQGAALDILELVPVTPDVPGAKPAVPDPSSTD